MSEPDILLTRIDNRLIHGQVGITWTKTIGTNLLLLVDDDVAQDGVLQQIMTLTAKQAGVDVRFWTVEKTISTIHKASPQQHIFIVVKTPHVARQLVEGGIKLGEVNVGNMHFSEGKWSISTKVYVNQQDLDDLHALEDAGCNVYIQDVPGDKKESVIYQH